MAKPFFLTRQTANLMEDFMRELKTGASLFLLYGDEGVGKTRLLQELSQKRLTEARIHWIDLGAGKTDDQGQLDSSAKVEAIFDAAGSGDIIIADHFESALKKARHQLFLSWSTDGVDKRLNLIIASDSKGFDELRQLSQQYQVRVHSFQQMPLKAEEVEAFLGFYLFPDHPIGKLSIPADLRKQLVATNGAIGRVIQIAERDGAQIGSSPMTDTETIRKGSRTMVTLLILFALAIGVGWYHLISRQDPAEVATADANQSGSVVVSEAVVETQIEVEPEPEPVPEPEPETISETEPETGTLTEEELEAEPETVAEAETESTVELQPEDVVAAEIETEPEPHPEIEPSAEPDTEAETLSEPGTASDSEAVLVENESQAEASVAATARVEAPEIGPQQPKLSDSSRFAQDLQSSMDWLGGKNRGVGTVQILLLSFATFDPVAYYEYIDYLATQQVDASKIRVFKTMTGGKEVYSVFYGEYDSRLAGPLTRSTDCPLRCAKSPRSRAASVVS